MTTSIAITHVNVVAMDTERVLEDQTVLVDEGRIVALGPANDFGTAIEAADVVDGRGKFLMPGLADMHVHFWDPGQAAMFVANGVTLVRNMTGSPLHMAMQRKLARRELMGPHIVTSTPLIDGLNADGRPAWPGSTVVIDPSQAASVVQGFAQAGYQQLKVYQLLTFEVHQALASAGVQHGMRVTGHCPDGMTFEQAIAHGQTCFEHLTNIGNGHYVAGREPAQIRRLGSTATFEQLVEAQQLMAEHVDFDAMRRLAASMAELQVWNCPTSTVWIKPAQGVDEAMRDPHLRYMHPQTVGEWQKRAGAGASPERARRRAELMELQDRGNTVRFRIAKLLLDEGAPLLLGTDTPNPFVVPGFSIHEELANLVNAGFSPFQALRCGTSEAARFLNASDDWGTISPGKRADLLLLSANPLRDVRAVAAPEAVLVNGFVLRQDALDRLLEERAAAVAAPLRPLDLPPPPSRARVVRSGTFQNSIGGEVNGYFTQRCAQVEDGSWLIEERRAIGMGQEATRRMWLAADFTVERIEDRYPSAIGEVRYDVVWDPQRSTYALRHEALDGNVRELTTGNRRLPPAWGTGLIALPRLLTNVKAESRVPVLNAAFQSRGPEDFVAEQMQVTPSPSGDEGRAWQVHLGGYVRTYRFAENGEFLEMSETLNGLPRRVVPLRPIGG
ncbi:MAG: amidohydrolase family protein [Chloroflexi bacterium]|nr:amidohydrolase family protein [Chloroflexota bacterium]